MDHRFPFAAVVAIAVFLCNPLRAATPTELTITDVTVIPMDKDSYDEHRVVTIRDGVIVNIAPLASLPSHPGAVIDGHGRFLIPGFVDAHVHIRPLRASLESSGPRFKQLSSELQPSHPYDSRVLFAYLREGVTTVFHLGGGGPDVLELRDLIQRGSVLGPGLIVGKLIDGPPEAVLDDLHKLPPPTSPDNPQTAADGRAAVEAAVVDHYDFIKSYQHLNQETYDAIEAAAHAAHLITMGHLPEIGCRTCVSREHPFLNPMDDIAHAEELGRYAMQNDLDPGELSVLTKWMLRARSMLTPTLITTRTIVYMYLHRHVPPVPEDVLNTVDPITLDGWQPERTRYLTESFRTQVGIDRYPAGFDFDRVLTRKLFRSGVSLLVGTDAQTVPGIAAGYSVHQEMLELSALGLTPYQVLRAATEIPHQLIRDSHQAGLVKVGQRADLVLLNSNPLADIRNASDIAGVIVKGRWLSALQLQRQAQENIAYFRRLEDRAGLGANRLRYVKDSEEGSP